MTRAALAIALLLGGACRAPVTDREVAGDRAYGAGRYPDAYEAYAAAVAGRGGSRLWAKAAGAALRAGRLGDAAEAWVRLAAEDPMRAGEAADGLEEIARTAAPRDTHALHAAVSGLRRVVPDRPIGAHALALVRRVALDGAEAVSILPQALAAGGDRGTVDSLLLEYGEALQATAACDEASDAFRAVLRRSSDPGLTRDAGSGLSVCALRLGLGALADNRPADAERLLVEVSGDSATWIGRRARLGLGDARLAQGDTAGAIEAFESAGAAAGTPDSISQLAAARLSALAATQSAGDSARTSEP